MYLIITQLILAVAILQLGSNAAPISGSMGNSSLANSSTLYSSDEHNLSGSNDKDDETSILLRTSNTEMLHQAKVVIANTRRAGSPSWGLTAHEADIACHALSRVENAKAHKKQENRRTLLHPFVDSFLDHLLDMKYEHKIIEHYEGHLLSIRTKDELAALVLSLRNVQQGVYWTGARVIRRPSTRLSKWLNLPDIELIWTDGSRGNLDVLGLSGDDLSRLWLNKEYCLAIDLYMNRWQARRCKDKLAYACILRPVLTAYSVDEDNQESDENDASTGASDETGTTTSRFGNSSTEATGTATFTNNDETVTTAEKVTISSEEFTTTTEDLNGNSKFSSGSTTEARDKISQTTRTEERTERSMTEDNTVANLTTAAGNSNGIDGQTEIPEFGTGNPTNAVHLQTDTMMSQTHQSRTDGQSPKEITLPSRYQNNSISTENTQNSAETEQSENESSVTSETPNGQQTTETETNIPTSEKKTETILTEDTESITEETFSTEDSVSPTLAELSNTQSVGTATNTEITPTNEETMQSEGENGINTETPMEKTTMEFSLTTTPPEIKNEPILTESIGFITKETPATTGSESTDFVSSRSTETEINTEKKSIVTEALGLEVADYMTTKTQEEQQTGSETKTETLLTESAGSIIEETFPTTGSTVDKESSTTAAKITSISPRTEINTETTQIFTKAMESEIGDNMTTKNSEDEIKADSETKTGTPITDSAEAMKEQETSTSQSTINKASSATATSVISLSPSNGLVTEYKSNITEAMGSGITDFKFEETSEEGRKADSETKTETLITESAGSMIERAIPTSESTETSVSSVSANFEMDTEKTQINDAAIESEIVSDTNQKIPEKEQTTESNTQTETLFTESTVNINGETTTATSTTVEKESSNTATFVSSLSTSSSTNTENTPPISEAIGSEVTDYRITKQEDDRTTNDDKKTETLLTESAGDIREETSTATGSKVEEKSSTNTFLVSSLFPGTGTNEDNTPIITETIGSEVADYTTTKTTENEQTTNIETQSERLLTELAGSIIEEISLATGSTIKEEPSTTTVSGTGNSTDETTIINEAVGSGIQDGMNTQTSNEEQETESNKSRIETRIETLFTDAAGSTTKETFSTSSENTMNATNQHQSTSINHENIEISTELTGAQTEGSVITKTLQEQNTTEISTPMFKLETQKRSLQTEAAVSEKDESISGETSKAIESISTTDFNSTTYVNGMTPKERENQTESVTRTSWPMEIEKKLSKVFTRQEEIESEVTASNRPHENFDGITESTDEDDTDENGWENVYD